MRPLVVFPIPLEERRCCSSHGPPETNNFLFHINDKMSADEPEIQEVHQDPHRIVSESDLEALQAVWQHDDAKDNLEASVDEAVWELLLQMVHPVPDRTYGGYTTPVSPEEDINTVVPPEETWEAWVDSSALERVRQLRAQVRQKSVSVQEKRNRVLNQVQDFLQQQQQQSQSSAAPKPPPLSLSVQQMCIEKTKETEEQVSSLVNEMDDLHVKMPDVVHRFHETLSTVQDEEHQRQAERAITALPNDVCMLTQGEEEDNEENKVPAEDRLLRFLTTQ